MHGTSPHVQPNGCRCSTPAHTLTFSPYQQSPEATQGLSYTVLGNLLSSPLSSSQHLHYLSSSLHYQCTTCSLGTLKGTLAK